MKAQALQDYPSRPITMIIPYGQQGTSNTLGRIIGQELSEVIGQPVKYDNRPGERGTIGAAFAAKAPADGYTLHFGNMTHMVYGYHYYPGRMPFDTLRDFTPICQTNARRFILVVHPSVPANSAGDLVALARSRPGQLRSGLDEHGGYGGICHLLNELFKRKGGIDFKLVAYAGSGPSILEQLMAGHLDFMFNNIPPVASAIKEGKLKPIAITTSERSPLMPDLPTMGESGMPGVEGNGWHGVFAPASTPSGIIARLHGALVKALRNPELITRLKQMGADVIGNSQEEFASFIRKEIDSWPRLVKEAGIRVA